MKLKSITFLALVFVGLSGCTKDDPDTIDNPSCPTPSLVVDANFEGNGFSFYSSTSGNYGFFEVQYGPNGFSLGNGTVSTISTSGSITNLTNGAYDVYLRGNCGGYDWSNWDGPRSVLITNGNSSTCSEPYNLSTSYINFDYMLNWNENSGDNYYELEVGPSGFTQGSGVMHTVNESFFREGVFTQGITYDFYVRANCGGSDWSTWAGPSSFVAEHNANRCLPPLGVIADRNGSSISIEIQPNGESRHEINFNSTSFNDESNIHLVDQINSTFSPFTAGQTYYVWVRSVCNDGSRTDWIGPTEIN